MNVQSCLLCSSGKVFVAEFYMQAHPVTQKILQVKTYYINAEFGYIKA